MQNVNGPDFGLDDSTAGYNAARVDAINKAKTQAQSLSKQLGVRLGEIVNFSESSGGYSYPMMYGLGGAAESKSATPDVPAGENTYNASVFPSPTKSDSRCLIVLDGIDAVLVRHSMLSNTRDPQGFFIY